MLNPNQDSPATQQDRKASLLILDSPASHLSSPESGRRPALREAKGGHVHLWAKPRQKSHPARVVEGEAATGWPSPERSGSPPAILVEQSLDIDACFSPAHQMKVAGQLLVQLE